jgi:hypothetical protein
MTLRRAARKDANKDAVVAALRSAGVSVIDLREPFDLLIAYARKTAMMEIKDGTKPPSARKLTKQQAKTLATWPAPLFVVASPEQAVQMAYTLAE